MQPDPGAVTQQVKGFLIPIFQSEPDEEGNRLNGLAPNDFQKVVDGYACANCLAEFSHYTVRCPVCGTTRNIQADLKEAPRFWTEYLRERDLDEPPYKPPVVNPFAQIEERVKAGEMETVRLGRKRRRR